MQQMHQGQLKGPSNVTEPGNVAHQNHPSSMGKSGPHGAQVRSPNPLLEPSTVLSAHASSLDDLVSGAAKDADKAANTGEDKAPATKSGTAEEKKIKKDKDKSKLVYSDNEISPEEKMAQLPRYAFVPAA